MDVVALVSRDGHERERAARSCALAPLTVRLLLIRGVEWVHEVREAALSRLAACPSDLLVEALDLAEQLAGERAWGTLLRALIDAQLSDDDLRRAYRSFTPRTRRAAWYRLYERNTLSANELVSLAAQDPDVGVRRIAARSLPGLSEEDRRQLAQVLIDDRVGSIAVPGLATLVELDGTQSIVNALISRSPTLRRAARDWARIRNVDARGTYLGLLAGDANHAVALVALADLGDRRDEKLMRTMLTDPRAGVRAAGLHGLSRIDRGAGRDAAITALVSGATGKVGRTAAHILRDGPPSSEEVLAITDVVLDQSRSPSLRLRCLSLLRPIRWVHLATMLEARDRTNDPSLLQRLDNEAERWLRDSSRVTRVPDSEVRARIRQLLPQVNPDLRQQIAFVLKTST